MKCTSLAPSCHGQLSQLARLVRKLACCFIGQHRLNQPMEHRKNQDYAGCYGPGKTMKVLMISRTTVRRMTATLLCFIFFVLLSLTIVTDSGAELTRNSLPSKKKAALRGANFQISRNVGIFKVCTFNTATSPNKQTNNKQTSKRSCQLRQLYHVTLSPANLSMLTWPLTLR